MKTIEDMGREYQRSDESDGTTATAFIDGAEWMYKELTRWYDLREKMPEINKKVLIRLLGGYIEMAYFDGDIWLYSISDYIVEYEIIGWREIHE